MFLFCFSRPYLECIFHLSPFRHQSTRLQLQWYDRISIGLFCLPLEFRNSCSNGIFGNKSTARTRLRASHSVHLVSVLEWRRYSSLHWDQARGDTGTKLLSMKEMIMETDCGIGGGVWGERLTPIWIRICQFVVSNFSAVGCWMQAHPETFALAHVCSQSSFLETALSQQVSVDCVLLSKGHSYSLYLPCLCLTRIICHHLQNIAVIHQYS